MKTRSGKQVEAGEQMESWSEAEREEKGQKKTEDFVERVEGAEAEGGYDEESEPELKKRKTTTRLPEGGKDEEQGAHPKAPTDGGGQCPAAAAPAAARDGGETAVATGGGETAEKGAGEQESGPLETGDEDPGTMQQEAKGEEEGGEQEGADAGEVERGRVYFFYRPKVAVAVAEGSGDVQRFFMVLHPSGEGKDAKARLAIIGKKRLPSVERKERLFGFIESVAGSAAELTQGLGSQRYETKTRGPRQVSAARMLGEGNYAILKHGDHTHLTYQLELPTPSDMGEVQEAFNLELEGSYILSIKNPKHPAGRGVGLQDKAEYSPHKRREFRHYSWIPAHDPQLLNTERCEFLLVGAADDLRAELGSGGGTVANSAGEDVRGSCPDSDEECLLEKMKEEIGAEQAGIETQPAATGEWK